MSALQHLQPQHHQQRQQLSSSSLAVRDGGEPDLTSFDSGAAVFAHVRDALTSLRTSLHLAVMDMTALRNRKRAAEHRSDLGGSEVE
jgi:hypothetical protein